MCVYVYYVYVLANMACLTFSRFFHFEFSISARISIVFLMTNHSLF